MSGNFLAREQAVAEIVEIADELGPIARRLEGAKSVDAAVVGKAESRLRVLASMLGAKSVEPRHNLADLGSLEPLDDADV